MHQGRLVFTCIEIPWRFGLKRRDLLLGFQKHFHWKGGKGIGVDKQCSEQVEMPWMMYARGTLPLSCPVLYNLRMLSSAENVQVIDSYYNHHVLCLA